MKKVFILCFAITGVLFTSCSKDDDEQTPEEALVGSWKISAEFDNDEAVEIEGCDKETIIKFDSNKTATYIDYDEDENNPGECVKDDDTESLTWSIAGDSLNFIYDEDDIESAIFSIDGNKLTLLYDDTDSDSSEEERFKQVYTRQ